MIDFVHLFMGIQERVINDNQKESRLLLICALNVLILKLFLLENV